MAKKAVQNRKKVIKEPEAEQPSVIFLDPKANKSTSLVLLGVLAVVLGFLSTNTAFMAQTIFSEKADFIVAMGFIGIVVGLILNNRKRISALFEANKKK